ncbi:PTS sugar transporter subunit IIA [Myxococcota bacterium]|nr:PTS sugar transporter subunit IIA [Myxococcota bacterium]
MKPISDFIAKKAILPEMKSRDKEGAIGELAQLLSNAYDNLDTKELYNLLLAREELCSTAMDGGMAIPHAKTSSVHGICGAFARSINGVEYGSSANEKTHLFFVLISPDKSAGLHLMALAQISRSFQDPTFRERIMQVNTVDEIYHLITGQ